MNLNLIILLTFFVVVVVLFWIIPTKKGKAITENLTSFLQVLPISKIAEALIKYFENKK